MTPAPCNCLSPFLLRSFIHQYKKEKKRKKRPLVHLLSDYFITMWILYLLSFFFLSVTNCINVKNMLQVWKSIVNKTNLYQFYSPYALYSFYPEIKKDKLLFHNRSSAWAESVEYATVAFSPYRMNHCMKIIADHHFLTFLLGLLHSIRL